MKLLTKRMALVITIICIFIIVLLPMGCANDGFELVKSVSYTTSGTVKSASSTYKYIYSSGAYITKEEYENSPLNSRLSDTSFDTKTIPNSNMIPQEAKGKTKYTANADYHDDNTRYYTWYNLMGQIRQYRLYYYQGTEYSLVYVKVVNSTTIIVRNASGDTTYTVTSYHINYFN